MADRFVNDPDRLNHTVEQSGKEYNLRLIQRTQSIFKNLIDLLPGNYISTIEGPNYSVEVKAVALELARLELALEDVKFDIDFETTRTDFLYTMIGYMVFMNGQLPTTDYDDEQFRQFLLNVIGIYFEGSIPKAMVQGVQLFLTGALTFTENFLQARLPDSGLDISDEFGFQIDAITTTTTEIGVLGVQSNTNRLAVQLPIPSSPYQIILSNGTSFQVNTVNTDGNFGTPVTGVVELSLSTGNLNWNTLDLTTYSGETVLFQLSRFPEDTFTLEANVRLILNIIRPAHTLFKIRYIFTDRYNPNGGRGILDSSRSSLSSYYYEDFRVYENGLLDLDRMGRKVNQLVVGEDHTGDF
jgi:hypothetical protein